MGQAGAVRIGQRQAGVHLHREAVAAAVGRRTGRGRDHGQRAGRVGRIQHDAVQRQAEGPAGLGRGEADRVDVAPALAEDDEAGIEVGAYPGIGHAQSPEPYVPLWVRSIMICCSGVALKPPSYAVMYIDDARPAWKSSALKTSDFSLKLLARSIALSSRNCCRDRPSFEMARPAGRSGRRCR